MASNEAVPGAASPCVVLPTPALIEEIRALTHEYSQYMDRKQVDALVELYLPDGVWDARPMGFGCYEGRDAIRRFFVRNFQMTRQLHHMVSNHLLRAIGPDEVEGSCCVIGWAWLEDGRRRVDWGIYEDCYARAEGRWRLRSRRLSPTGPGEFEEPR